VADEVYAITTQQRAQVIDLRVHGDRPLGSNGLAITEQIGSQHPARRQARPDPLVPESADQAVDQDDRQHLRNLPSI
jgi:hypothetical protein